MEFRPYFEDDLQPHHFKESDSEDAEEYDEDEEQEEEYDAINDETFGGDVNELGGSEDLVDFANRTADLILDEPTCSIKAPDPSQIPLPQVASVLFSSSSKGSTPYEGSYDKSIWDSSSFNGIGSLNSDLSAHLSNNSRSNKDSDHAPNSNAGGAPYSAGIKTLEEIEREELALQKQKQQTMSSPQPPASSAAPLSLEDLERRMLLEAAGSNPQQAIGQMGSSYLPPPAWHCVNMPPPGTTTTATGSSSLGQFPPLLPAGQMPPPYLAAAFMQANRGVMPPPLPPAVLQQMYMSQQQFGHGPPHPMFPPFQGPPPPLPPPNHQQQQQQYSHQNNKHFHGANNNNNSNNSRNVRAVRIPVPGSWMKMREMPSRGSHNNSPFQPMMYQGNSNSNSSYNNSRQPGSSAFSNQGSSMAGTPSRQHTRQKGLPSGRTIADYAFDPYAGFMSKKEREWLIKIHLIQSMGGGEPMDDDFYYTMWKKRNVLAKAPDEWKVKLQPKYYNFDDTYPSAAYVSPQFSGALGKPTHCSANFPRQMIDLSSADNAEEEDGNNPKNTQKKLKAMLMRIENASLVLLKCEDIKRKLAAPELSEQEQTGLKDSLKEQMELLISSTCTRDKLPTIMMIQKGRVLLFQAMAGVWQQSDLFDILKVMMETMPKYAKKIPDGSVTDVIKHISSFLSLLTKEQFLELVNCAAVDKELVQSSKLVQLTLFTFLVGLTKHAASVADVSGSSLASWLKGPEKECVPLEDIAQFFASEDLLAMKQWLVKEEIAGAEEEGRNDCCGQRVVAVLDKLLLSQ